MILLMETEVTRSTVKALYLTPSMNGQACWEMREQAYDQHTVKLDDLDPQDGRFISAGSLQSLLLQFIHQMSLVAKGDERVQEISEFMRVMNDFLDQARRTLNVKRYFVHDTAPNNAFPVDENDMQTFSLDPEFANCHEVAGPEIPLVRR